jgi:hypothetical protein
VRSRLDCALKGSILALVNGSNGSNQDGRFGWKAASAQTFARLSPS